MIIIVNKSDVLSDTVGEVTLAGLAGVTFEVTHTPRDAEDHRLAVTPLLGSEEEREAVLAWSSQNLARRKVVQVKDEEIDSALWLPATTRLATIAYAKKRLQTAKAILSVPLVDGTPTLEQHKASRLTQVDAKTDELIAQGFMVEGKMFSASDTAQLKWLGMLTSRAALSYPVTVPTNNDLEFVSLANEDDIVLYYTALLTRVQVLLTGGVFLKGQIVAASTKGELDAIVDNRT